MNLQQSCRSRSGLFDIIDVLFEGIGMDGFGRFCISAKACCTASCLTSVIHNTSVTYRISNVVYNMQACRLFVVYLGKLSIGYFIYHSLVCNVLVPLPIFYLRVY